MERILISHIGQHIGEKVTIAGWAQTIRDQGSIKFIHLRDVSGTMQVVVLKNATEAFAVAGQLSLESVISVQGVAKEEAQAPGGVEIAAEHITVLSHAEPELPIPIVEKGEVGETELQAQMDWKWIDLRKPEKLLIFKAWTMLEQGFREYWLKEGFLEIHSPKLMSSPSESRAELFEVPYFGSTAYLAQSPQFYKQMAMAAGFEKVFEIGPVFRADPSFTSRHATEFTSVDAELSFIDSHQGVIKVLEGMISHALTLIHAAHAKEVRELYDREIVIPKMPFPQITMADAKALLQSNGIPSEREGDLSPEEEKELCVLMKEKTGHEFVFVTEYPSTVRPFYHMRMADDPSITKSFDLLWNGIEITTGAQREHRYENLRAQAIDKGLDSMGIEHYLNFFKYGCPPHGGFGLGPARMVMKLLNIDNIRKVSYVYRGIKRLTP